MNAINETDNIWKDERGVKYSQDKKYLLSADSYEWDWANSKLHKYCIQEGTIIISDRAFSSFMLREFLYDIIIPESVIQIGSYAFNGCGISEIILPESIIEIGEDAFSNCKYLSKVIIPLNLSVISNSLFEGCIKLKSIILHEGIKEIGDFAFKGCSSLSKITIPDSVKKMGANPFLGCSNLLEIECKSDNFVFVNGALYTGDYKILIYYNNQDEHFSIPDFVKEIGNSAFEGCDKLKSVDVPDTVNVIGASAFKDCSFLKKINIPKKVISIGEYAFSGCASLKQIDLTCEINNIPEGLFELCVELEKIALPGSIEKIGSYSFYRCGCLKHIDIPYGVEVIESNAFSRCLSLSEIILSERVSVIGDEAFFECHNLESVYIPNSITAIGEYVFDGCNHIKNILMPVGKKELYKDIFESGSIIEVEDHLSTIKADKEGHIYVDLGLSVYWSFYNIGVSKNNIGGEYYGWGEVETPDNLDAMDWAYYKHSKIDGSSDEVLLTKYCNQTSKGANNCVDNKTILDLIDDAANVNWGDNWRIPTKDEFNELLNEKNCIWVWTKLNGMYGYKVISKKNCCEGNWIFLPAAGARVGMGYDRVGISGYYWTSSLYDSRPINAVMLSFDFKYHNLGYGDRYTGLPIRPVLPKN